METAESRWKLWLSKKKRASSLVEEVISQNEVMRSSLLVLLGFASSASIFIFYKRGERMCTGFSFDRIACFALLRLLGEGGAFSESEQYIFIIMHYFYFIYILSQCTTLFLRRYRFLFFSFTNPLLRCGYFWFFPFPCRCYVLGNKVAEERIVLKFFPFYFMVITLRDVTYITFF